MCKSALRVRYMMHRPYVMNHNKHTSNQTKRENHRNIPNLCKPPECIMPLGIRSPYRACCPPSRPSIPSTQNTIKEQETKSGPSLSTHNTHMLSRKDLHHPIPAATDYPPTILAPHDGTYPFAPHEAMAREFLDATPLFEAP